MIDIMLLLLGGVLGFAHAARSWLAIRMKEGKRCIPKTFLWRGVRNLVVSLAILVAFIYIGQNSSTAATDTVTPGASLFTALFLFSVGFGIGHGLSNLSGGTLSFVTKGPYQPTENSDQLSKNKPKTDDYGQIEK